MEIIHLVINHLHCVIAIIHTRIVIILTYIAGFTRSNSENYESLNGNVDTINNVRTSHNNPRDIMNDDVYSSEPIDNYKIPYNEYFLSIDIESAVHGHSINLKLQMIVIHIPTIIIP